MIHFKHRVSFELKLRLSPAWHHVIPLQHSITRQLRIATLKKAYTRLCKEGHEAKTADTLAIVISQKLGAQFQLLLLLVYFRACWMHICRCRFCACSASSSLRREFMVTASYY